MQFITICILVVITSQVNADGNNFDMEEYCESSFVKKHNPKKISLGEKWCVYISNVTVLIAGCCGNFVVIYSLVIRKEKVTKFNLFNLNTCIVALFLLLKQHFNKLSLVGLGRS